MGLLSEYQRRAEVLDKSSRVVFDNRKPGERIDVSIVIPVFNQSGHLRTLLNSFLERRDSLIENELIIVDDCSDENISEVIQDNKSRPGFRCVLLSNADNIGFADACNNGAREVRGRFVLFLNSDIVITQADWLAKMMSCFDDKEVGAVSPVLLYPDQETIQYAGAMITDCDFGHPFFDHKHFHKGYPKELAQSRFCESFSAACVMMLAQTFTTLAGFDSEFSRGYGFEDLDLALRMKEELGLLSYVCSDVNLIHEESASYGKSVHHNPRKNVNGFQFLEKWRGRIDTQALYHEFNNKKSPNDKPVCLIISHGLPPEKIAGVEVYTYQLVREMARSGQADVWCLYASLQPNQKNYPTGTILFDRMIGDAKVFKMVNSHPDYNFFFNHGRIKNSKNDLVQPWFIRFLREINPDIVHFQHTNFMSIDMVKWTKENSRAQTVYTLNEFLPICAKHGQLVDSEMELCEGFHPVKCTGCFPRRPVSDFILRSEAYRSALVDNSDLLIAPSQFVRQKFIEWGVPDDKVVFSDYGFKKYTEDRKDPMDFKTKDVLTFGFLGTITPYKGVDVLLEAFREPIAKARLDINGICQSTDIQAEIDKATTNEWISYHGPYDPDAIPAILSRIDVLVVPSTWWENSPLVIHEAMMYGIPVLVSDVGGMAELVTRHGGFTFKRADSSSLRNKIAELCKNRDELAEVSADDIQIKSIREDVNETIGRYKKLVD